MNSRRPAEQKGRRWGLETEQNGRSSRTENKDITKYYVARLPGNRSSKDISEVLGTLGDIARVYIARKRDKSGYRYGFASFKGVKYTRELEKRMSNVWMGIFKLFINVAKFTKENEDRSDEETKDQKFKTKEDKLSDQATKENFRYGNYVSNGFYYAGVVAGKHQETGRRKEVVVFEFAKAYVELHGSAIIGKTKDLWTLRKLKIVMKEANYGDSIIKYLGGLNVFIVFKSSFEAESFRVDVLGFGWFNFVEIWRGQPVAFERLAWLKIYGIPLHLAGNETYDSVRRCFGKVIHASQRQMEDNFLLYDCVCVMIDVVKRMEEEVVIVEEGKRFRVWVEEERGDWTLDSVDNQFD
ncbi:putative nucleotide-binding alpha-beta plait domain superfamily, RNA-binding domain superfamily [Helianthus annuus]|nr:putative nucleotide-binding alpha-beta plait domain superfamily, RNA-binding domain superfamily [Helianthus annuus]KAJ0769407.1 putative nucleotide-binding alpha-beta plait domain superfamily, RNA-binding domain superfamily [Helianthus annuus]KAJ0945209.1 putative nucleotide-binding alpha-beta plait domain superfamily, RNA-binding domain superfamily [Helianthus annuus]